MKLKEVDLKHLAIMESDNKDVAMVKNKTNRKLSPQSKVWKMPYKCPSKSSQILAKQNELLVMEDDGNLEMVKNTHLHSTYLTLPMPQEKWTVWWSKRFLTCDTVDKRPNKLKEKWSKVAFVIQDKVHRRPKFKDIVDFIHTMAQVAVHPVFGLAKNNDKKQAKCSAKHMTEKKKYFHHNCNTS